MRSSSYNQFDDDIEKQPSPSKIKKLAEQFVAQTQGWSKAQWDQLSMEQAATLAVGKDETKERKKKKLKSEIKSIQEGDFPGVPKKIFERWNDPEFRDNGYDKFMMDYVMDYMHKAHYEYQRLSEMNDIGQGDDFLIQVCKLHIDQKNNEGFSWGFNHLDNSENKWNFLREAVGLKQDQEILDHILKRVVQSKADQGRALGVAVDHMNEDAIGKIWTCKWSKDNNSDGSARSLRESLLGLKFKTHPKESVKIFLAVVSNKNIQTILSDLNSITPLVLDQLIHSDVSLKDFQSVLDVYMKHAKTDGRGGVKTMVNNASDGKRSALLKAMLEHPKLSDHGGVVSISLDLLLGDSDDSKKELAKSFLQDKHIQDKFQDLAVSQNWDTANKLAPYLNPDFMGPCVLEAFWGHLRTRAPLIAAAASGSEIKSAVSEQDHSKPVVNKARKM